MQIAERHRLPLVALLEKTSLVGLACLAGFVTLSTAYGQFRSTFAVPYWDQWSTYPDYLAWTAGGLGLKQLLAQSNEHRILFPRLIMFVDLAVFGGRNAFNVLLCDVFQIAHLVLIGWVGRRVLVGSFPGRVACLFIVSAMLSGAQYENIYWGFQVQFVMVYLFAALAFTCAIRAGSTLDRRRKAFWVSACLASGFIASFSMANGLMVWPLLAAILILRRAGTPAVTAALAAAVTAGVVYARRYVPVPHHTPATAFLHQPWVAASYLLTYFGSLVAPEDTSGAKVAATVLLLLLVGLLARQIMLRERLDSAAAFAWSSVSFVVLSGIVTTVGRFGFGDTQALSSRYVTPGAMLWSAVAILAVQATVHPVPPSRRVLCSLVLGGLTLWICGVNQPVAMTRMADHEAKMAAASDALIAGVTDPTTLADLGPFNAQILTVSALLRVEGLSLFGSREANWMGKKLDQVFVVDHRAFCMGSFDTVRDLGAGGALVEGWAWAGPGEPPPSEIVVADASGAIVGFARGLLNRADVAAARPQLNDNRVGFRGYVSPTRQGTLSAYALRSARPSICWIGENKDARLSRSG